MNFFLTKVWTHNKYHNWKVHYIVNICYFFGGKIPELKKKNSLFISQHSERERDFSLSRSRESFIWKNSWLAQVNTFRKMLLYTRYRMRNHRLSTRRPAPAVLHTCCCCYFTLSRYLETIIIFQDENISFYTFWQITLCDGRLLSKTIFDKNFYILQQDIKFFNVYY